jgi:hypothetical protein
MRRYQDAATGRQALMRVVVDDTADELVIVTVYKASRFKRYLRGLVP